MMCSFGQLRKLVTKERPVGRMSLDPGLTGAKTDSVFLKMNKNSDMQTQDMVKTCNN